MCGGKRGDLVHGQLPVIYNEITLVCTWAQTQSLIRLTLTTTSIFWTLALVRENHLSS